MLLVRSRYALRGRKELKSELGGEEEGRVTQEKGGDMASCHLATLHSEHGPAAAAVVDLNQGARIYG